MNIDNLEKKIKDKVLFTDDENNIYISKFEKNINYIIKTNLIGRNQIILDSFPCSKMEFNNTNILMFNNIFLVVFEQKNYLVIKKINKLEQKLESEKRYYIKGNKLDASNVLCIDENNIIVFLHETNSFSYDGFLCDLLENKSYFINDRRIIDSTKKHFEVYQCGKDKYVCFEEEYMDDWEKEQIFKAVKSGEIILRDCFESINIIKVNDLLNSIKSDLKQIPFKVIDIVSLSGCVKYIGMNKTHIYYRHRNFNTHIEKVYSISKIKLRRKLIMEIPYNS